MVRPEYPSPDLPCLDQKLLRLGVSLLVRIDLREVDERTDCPGMLGTEHLLFRGQRLGANLFGFRKLVGPYQHVPQGLHRPQRFGVLRAGHPALDGQDFPAEGLRFPDLSLLEQGVRQTAPARQGLRRLLTQFPATNLD